MQRNLGVIVSVELVMDDVEQRMCASKEVGKFTKIVWNETFARGEFEREGTRFQICLTRITEYHDKPLYMVSVPNFKYALETTNPVNVAYKMQEETETPKVDCESVEMAVRQMKSFMDDYEQQQTGVHMNLVNANYHLNKAHEFLVEANKDGQMDYVSHPALSSVFDYVYSKAVQIEKIMYQK